jgi:hypothetical protein
MDTSARADSRRSFITAAIKAIGSSGAFAGRTRKMAGYFAQLRRFNLPQRLCVPLFRTTGQFFSAGLNGTIVITENTGMPGGVPNGTGSLPA